MLPSVRLIRLRTIQIEKHSRSITQIQKTIMDLEFLVGNLNHEIRAEEARARIHDTAHVAYPTYAKAAIHRRNNLLQSIDKLKIQLDATKNVLRENNEESETAMRLLD
jgi:flagellar FliJ protein